MSTTTRNTNSGTTTNEPHSVLFFEASDEEIKPVKVFDSEHSQNVVLSSLDSIMRIVFNGWNDQQTAGEHGGFYVYQWNRFVDTFTQISSRKLLGVNSKNRLDSVKLNGMKPSGFIKGRFEKSRKLKDLILFPEILDQWLAKNRKELPFEVGASAPGLTASHLVSEWLHSRNLKVSKSYVPITPKKSQTVDQKLGIKRSKISTEVPLEDTSKVSEQILELAEKFRDSVREEIKLDRTQVGVNQTQVNLESKLPAVPKRTVKINGVVSKNQEEASRRWELFVNNLDITGMTPYKIGLSIAQFMEDSQNVEMLTAEGWKPLEFRKMLEKSNLK